MKRVKTEKEMEKMRIMEIQLKRWKRWKRTPVLSGGRRTSGAVKRWLRQRIV
jgi:hypothetical protein